MITWICVMVLIKFTKYIELNYNLMRPSFQGAIFHQNILTHIKKTIIHKEYLLYNFLLYVEHANRNITSNIHNQIELLGIRLYDPSCITFYAINENEPTKIYFQTYLNMNLRDEVFVFVLVTFLP